MINRLDIYKKKLNSISTVIATENWIIKTSLYNVHFAHQSDTSLSVAKVSESCNSSKTALSKYTVITATYKIALTLSNFSRQRLTTFHKTLTTPYKW